MNIVCSRVYTSRVVVYIHIEYTGFGFINVDVFRSCSRDIIEIKAWVVDGISWCAPIESPVYTVCIIGRYPLRQLRKSDRSG